MQDDLNLPSAKQEAIKALPFETQWQMVKSHTLSVSIKETSTPEYYLDELKSSIEVFD